jgi:hypothetical protein
MNFVVPFWLHMPAGVVLTALTMTLLTRIAFAIPDPRIKSIKIGYPFMIWVLLTMTYWSWIIWG